MLPLWDVTGAAQLITHRRPAGIRGIALFIVVMAFSLPACGTKTPPMSQAELTDFATRYAAAWSGQDPAELASFYDEAGSLSVNGGEATVGRAAIAVRAREYMEAFPDMVVRMDSVIQAGNRATFHWTWTGTNSGPGGTGRQVQLSGFEEWTFSAKGLILESQGHYDEAEYQRQMSSDSGGN